MFVITNWWDVIIINKDQLILNPDILVRAVVYSPPWRWADCDGLLSS